RGDRLSVDAKATEERRGAIRLARSPGARPPEGLLHQGTALNEYLVVEEGSLWCVRCGHFLGPADANFKLQASIREGPLTKAGPAINRHGPSPRFVLREFSCGGCGTMLEVEVNLRGSPIIWDAWVRG
ncbi:MAG TPA: acetone carboxylase subunit gamma, partial [Dehalococcoidia bacterium]|nr:acetone carboxylase subunit gamma [Dehalococcoidia bacterium]